MREGARVKAATARRLDEPWQPILPLIEQELGRALRAARGSGTERDGSGCDRVPRRSLAIGASRPTSAASSPASAGCSSCGGKRRMDEGTLRGRVSQLGRRCAATRAVRRQGEEISRVHRRELQGVRDLFGGNLIPTRVTALERDAARLEGERGQLSPPSPRAKEDFRDRAADHPGRPDYAQRRCQGACRHPRQISSSRNAG